MLGEFTQEDLSGALDAVADGVLSSSGYQNGTVDCLRLAQALGLTVAWDHFQAGRARFVRLHHAATRTPHGSILLKPDPRRERVQWAVAHEIGEHQAHLVFSRLGVDPCEAPPGVREKVANWLAGRILLPGNPFLMAAKECDWDLPTLKLHFTTASHELIARRMLDFEPLVVITLLDHGQVSFRRGNLPGRTPPLLPIERRCQMQAHATSQYAGGDDGHLRVAAWPIHEPDWKREILRSAWPDEFVDASDTAE